jgi:predicted amidohydrolase YtcJ
MISAITLGITVSRHLVKSDELAAADPDRIIELLRPCLHSLAASAAPQEAGTEDTREDSQEDKR